MTSQVKLWKDSLLRFKHGISTTFVRDNCDKNSRFLTATDHFHGATTTVLRFPHDNQPGVSRVRPSYESLSEEEKKADLTKNLENFKNVKFSDTDSENRATFLR